MAKPQPGEVSAPLPRPLTEYIRATNEHDVDAVLATFATEAIVEDDGQHLGLAAIRKWIEDTVRRYDFTVEVKDAHEADGKTVVTGAGGRDVSG